MAKFYRRCARAWVDAGWFSVKTDVIPPIAAFVVTYWTSHGAQDFRLSALVIPLIAGLVALVLAHAAALVWNFILAGGRLELDAERAAHQRTRDERQFQGVILRAEARVTAIDVTGLRPGETMNTRNGAVVKVWNDERGAEARSARNVVPWLTFFSMDYTQRQDVGPLQRGWLPIDINVEGVAGFMVRGSNDPIPEEQPTADFTPNGIPFQVLIAESWGTGLPWAAAIPLVTNAYLGRGAATNLVRGKPLIVRLELRGEGVSAKNEWWFQLEYLNAPEPDHPETPDQPYDLALAAIPAPVTLAVGGIRSP